MVVQAGGEAAEVLNRLSAKVGPGRQDHHREGMPAQSRGLHKMHRTLQDYNSHSTL